jgi:outer membrane translocation and assembly module TamA
VIAARVNACGASDDTPFYDLCLIGQYQDLRGYSTGQYRDRLMLTGQAEYRLELWKRIGAVTFAGLGEVSPSIGRFSTNDLLPSAGAGLRFRLTRQNHMNLRMDYAWGTKSNAFYMSVAEAF